MPNKKDLSSKIIIAAGAILFLMILFPPKVVSTNMLGQRISQSVGHQFILTDPAGAQKGVEAGMPQEIANAMFAGTGVEYGKLFLQLVIVIGVAVAAVMFFAKPVTAPMNTATPTL
jgi:hypothetical protein